jgi:hypothetical protein
MKISQQESYPDLGENNNCSNNFTVFRHNINPEHFMFFVNNKQS